MLKTSLYLATILVFESILSPIPVYPLLIQVQTGFSSHSQDHKLYMCSGRNDQWEVEWIAACIGKLLTIRRADHLIMR